MAMRILLVVVLAVCLAGWASAEETTTTATTAQETPSTPAVREEYSRLESLENLHVRKDHFSRVKRLLKEARLRRLTALEHIQNREEHEKDMQRRSDEYAKENALRALARRNERQLIHERRKRVRLHKELIAAEETISRERRHMRRQQRELEAVSARHQALIDASKYRQDELDRAKDMEKPYLQRGVDIPDDVQSMEDDAIRRLRRVKHMTERNTIHLHHLESLARDEPSKLSHDLRHASKLRKAEKEASEAVAKLDEPAVNFASAVKADARDIGSRLKDRLQRMSKLGVAEVRAHVTKLLDQAAAEKDASKKRDLLRKARNYLALGRLLFHHMGDIGAKVDAASKSNNVDNGHYNEVDPDLQKQDEEAAAAAKEDEESTKAVIAPAPAAPLPKATQPDPTAHASENLRTCLTHVAAVRAAVNKRSQLRRKQLMTIGYCLVKLDELQHIESHHTSGDDEVMAAALEMLNVDKNLAERNGPDYIQKTLVNMGIHLRKQAKHDKKVLAKAKASCGVYCASVKIAKADRLGAKYKARKHAEKQVNNLTVKMMTIQGELKEAKAFFLTARDDAKQRLSTIGHDLTLVSKLQDKVDQMNDGTTQDVDEGDDASLMASLEVLAVRRPLAHQLFVQMTADDPSLDDIKELLFKLKDSILAERKYVIEAVKQRRESAQKLITRQSKVMAALDAARADLEKARETDETAQGKTAELRRICANVFSIHQDSE